MNRTITTTALLITMLGASPMALAASTDVRTRHVKHQLDAARSAQDRLQMVNDRFCNTLCKRMSVDLYVVDQALRNFENQVRHGTFDGEGSRVQIQRVVHQFDAVRSALDRLEWVGTKQDDRWQKRVKIDVAILEQVVQNLENHAKNALRDAKTVR